MADEPKWFQPGYAPQVTRRPTEPLWTVQKNGRHVACELRDDRKGFGVEVQLTRDGEFYAGRRLDTRDLALAHAEQTRIRLERDGWKE